MRIAVTAVLAILLAGCATPPPAPLSLDSPCAQNEASYECQVQRYRDVNSD